MDDANSIWQVGIIALIAGALFGALAYRLFAPSVRKADEVKSDLDQARDELVKYKASIDEHFQKTSELVNDLTQDYVKVYQHLAEGAQTLGDSKHFNNLLEQQKGRVLISVDEQKPAPEVIDSDPVAAAAVDPEAAAAKPDEHAEPYVDTKSDGSESKTDGGEAPESAAAADAPQAQAPRAPAGTGEAIIDTAKLEADADKVDVPDPKSQDADKARPVTH